MKIILIGCGNMGGAMLRGWLAGGLIKHAVIVDHAVHELRLEFSDYAHLMDFCLDASDVPDDVKADMIVLAIKPQQMAEMLPHLAPRVQQGLPILTVAAGLRISFYQKHIPGHPIIRVMPNTPAMIGKGSSVAITNDNISSQIKSNVEALMKSTGDFFWVQDEGLLDIAIAMNATGAGLFFKFAEVMAQSGAANGLTEEQAMRLARQTFIGAAAMAENYTDTSLAQMRINVTSKGGTTEAALKTWDENDMFFKAVDAGVKACIQRSRELAGD